MAQQSFRANLKVEKIPLLSELHGPTVIMKGQDQNYNPIVAEKNTTDSSVGIPQIYYCHNVVPTEQGYKSVGYEEQVPVIYPENTNFSNVVTIWDSDGTAIKLASTTAGNIFILKENETSWQEPDGAPAAAAVAGKRVTTAFVSGVTYVYFANHGCYTYNFNTDTLEPVTLAGVTVENIIGITANKGYLLVYSIDSVAWSSVLDPTDLVPSLSTGAGGGQIEGIRGEIVTIESVYGGLLVFARDNVVAGIASDNTRYPYNFSEVTGAGGLADPNFVSYDSNSGAVYAYTTSGLQSVSLKSAATVFPEITDFLSGGKIEDFDPVGNTLFTTNVSSYVLQKKIVVVADRYLIISYGVSSLTHCLFYDSALKQWGKLKITHTDCFGVKRSSKEIPKHSIAFLTAGGGVYVLDPTIDFTGSDGVILLGKYQFVRSRFIQLEKVTIENVQEGDTFSLYALVSIDGKNIVQTEEGYLLTSENQLREYLFHVQGKSITLLGRGKFNLTGVQLNYSVTGES